jgi:hypothetical protein
MSRVSVKSIRSSKETLFHRVRTSIDCKLGLRDSEESGVTLYAAKDGLVVVLVLANTCSSSNSFASAGEVLMKESPPMTALLALSNASLRPRPNARILFER